jgi:hypothetical protein
MWTHTGTVHNFLLYADAASLLNGLPRKSCFEREEKDQYILLLILLEILPSSSRENSTQLYIFCTYDLLKGTDHESVLSAKQYSNVCYLPLIF